MGFRAGIYLLVAAVGMLTAMGLGLLDQGSSRHGGGLAAVAAPLLASNGGGNSGGNSGGGNSGGGNSGGGNSGDSGNSGGSSPTSTPTPKPPGPTATPQPAPPATSGPCTFILGFADLHRTLSGKDGTCVDNEHDDPNGTGDRVQTTVKPDGSFGYMVWQKFSNSMRWTDGFRTFTYSKCLLQERLNTATFAWEKNPNLLVQPGDIPPPGACDLS